MSSLDAVLSLERSMVSNPYRRPAQAGRLRTQRTGRAPVATAPSTEPVPDTKFLCLAVCLGEMDWAGIGDDDADEQQRLAQAKIYSWKSPRALAEKAQAAGECIRAALEDGFTRLRANMDVRGAYDPNADVVRESLRQLVASARAATEAGPKRARVMFYYCSHSRIQRPDMNALYFPTASTKRPTSAQISLADLLHYDGIVPSTIIVDSPSAGSVLKRLNNDLRQRAAQQQGGRHGAVAAAAAAPATNPANHPEFFLGSCGANEVLPNHPLLPSDIFTACLVSPIRMAMLWFIVKHRTLYDIPLALIHAIPNADDLRGDLYKTFAAVLDCIAQTAAPQPHDYQRLFRQDPAVVHVFRHYLLAEHIITQLGRTPCTYPALVPTHDHTLWATVDSLLDRVASTVITACRLAPSLATRTGAELTATSQLQQRADLHEGRPSHQRLRDAAAPALDGLALTTFDDGFDSIVASLQDAVAFHVPPAAGTSSGIGLDVTAATERLPLVFTGTLRAQSRIAALRTLARYLDVGGHTALLMCERMRLFGDILAKLWAKNDPALWPSFLFVTAKSAYADLKLIPRQVHMHVIKYVSGVLTAPVITPDPSLGPYGSIAGVRLSAACVLVSLLASNVEYGRAMVAANVPQAINDLLIAIGTTVVPPASASTNATTAAAAMASMPASPLTRSASTPFGPAAASSAAPPPSLLGVETGDFAAFRPWGGCTDSGAAGFGAAGVSDHQQSGNGGGTPAMGTPTSGGFGDDGGPRTVVEHLEHVLLSLTLLLSISTVDAGVETLRVCGRAVTHGLGAASPETRRAALRCVNAASVLALRCCGAEDIDVKASTASVAAHLAEALLAHTKREAGPLVRFEIASAACAYLASCSPREVEDAALLAGGAAPGGGGGGVGGITATLSPGSHLTPAFLPTIGGAAAPHHHHPDGSMMASRTPGSVPGTMMPTGTVTGIAAPTPVLSSVRVRPATASPAVPPADAGLAGDHHQPGRAPTGGTALGAASAELPPLAATAPDDGAATAGRPPRLEVPTTDQPPSLDLGSPVLVAQRHASVAETAPLATRVLEYTVALLGDVDPSVRYAAIKGLLELRDSCIAASAGHAAPATLRASVRMGGIEASTPNDRGGAQPWWVRVLGGSGPGGGLDPDDEALSMSTDLPRAVVGDAMSVEEVVLDSLQFLSAPLVQPIVLGSGLEGGIGGGSISGLPDGSGSSQYLAGAITHSSGAGAVRLAALDAYTATVATHLCTTFGRLEVADRGPPPLQSRLVYEGVDGRAFAFHPTLPYVAVATPSPPMDVGEDGGAVVVLATAGDQPRHLCAFRPHQLANSDGAAAAATWSAAAAGGGGAASSNSNPATPKAAGGPAATGRSAGGGGTGGTGGGYSAAAGNTPLAGRLGTSSITALEIIDPSMSSLLMTVSSNGAVNIIGGFTSPHTVHRVASFPTLAPEYRAHRTRCAAAYQPQLHWAHVSGWRAAVSSWDLERQLAVDERSDAANGSDTVSVIAAHRTNPFAYFVAYAGSGGACLVDTRVPKNPVHRVPALRSSCLELTPARHNAHWFTTVSALGIVRTWDDRRSSLVFKEFTLDDMIPHPMAQSPAHGAADLSASASGSGGPSAYSVPSLSAVTVHSCSARRPLTLAARDGRARVYGRESAAARLPLRGQGAVLACLWHPTRLLAAVGVASPVGRGSAVSIFSEGVRETTEDVFDL